MSIKINDNSLLSLRTYFNEKLKDLYPEEELNSLFFIGINHYLKLSRLDFMRNPDALVSESEILRIRSLAKELKKEKPIQYIIGETDFMDLKIKVNKNVLIPRPETEELVDDIFKHVNNAESILDLCSGSGCISLALKKHYSKAEVLGIDISKEAIELSKRNASINKLNLTFIEDDVLTISSSFAKADIIVSNPPYVCENEKLMMSNNVLNFEPHLALFVEGDDPLLFYRAIISIAVEKLNTEGWLYMEINEKFGKEIIELMDKAGINRSLSINKDLNGKDRWVSGQINK